MADARHPQVKAYLCNNPRWEQTFRNPITKVEIPVKALPILAADFGHLPCGGSWQVGATVFAKDQRKLISLESVAPSQSGRIRWSWELDEPLPNPWTIHIWARQGSYLFEETIGLRIYCLSGKVTDFNGKPIQGVVCANGVQGVATPTDDCGRYELWLPDRHIPSLMAADAGYGKSTLQCWVYDCWPEDDLTLDMRVGQIELYELHAWRGYCGAKVDFLPMSVGLVNALLGEGKPYCGKVISPEVSLDDIEVELDGTPVEVVSVHSREEIPKPGQATAPSPYSRQEYSLQVADPGASPKAAPGSPQVLRVAIQHCFEKGRRSVIERGEGFYLGLRSGIGVSGGTTSS